MHVNITDERIAIASGIAKGMSRERCHDEGEVLGEAFLALVEAGLSGLSPEEAEARVRRECRNALRRQWRDENRVSFVARKGGIITAPDHSDLWEGIKALPPRQYRAIHLHFWEGLEYPEVATEMGCTEKAAQNLGCRALANLQKILSGKRGLSTSRLRTASEGKEISGYPPGYQERTNMLLTLSAVARVLGISEKMARTIAKDLPAVRVGKRNRYPASAVEAFAKTATPVPNIQAA
jgi:hypothetical protein